MRNCFGLMTLIAIAVLVPTASVDAQVITGVVRDASGAVLPGVTVEVSSPALIEKVRTLVTDGVGQYRAVNLRPGIYTATFTLPGFTTVQREGIEVTGDGVFTVNVDLRVGELAETITVTGASPVVDVQSTRRQAVLTDDVIAALPSTRNYAQLLNAVPALQNGNLDSQAPIIGQDGRFFNSYGGRPNEGRVLIDGMSVGQTYNGGGVGFSPDPSTAEEMQVTIAGGLGEHDIGSAMVNFVPKTGGNAFSGQAFVSTSGDWSQTTNLDDRLRSFGISQSGLIKQWDVSTSLGGPLKQDKLWFFTHVRDRGDALTVPGRFANLNAGDPTKWNFVSDPNVSVRNAGSTRSFLGRLTAQVTPRNKVSLSWDQQFACNGSAYEGPSCRVRGKDWIANGNATAAPETQSNYLNSTPLDVGQLTWSSPVTNRLLLEAGFSTFHSVWGWNAPPGALTALIPVTETASNATTGTPVPNFTYRGMGGSLNGTTVPIDNTQRNTNWRGSVSYVTGAHNIKFGYQGGLASDNQVDQINDSGLAYTFVNGQPSSFSMRIGPWHVANRTGSLGIYAQDQWTFGRATIQGAVRYDRASSWYPVEGNGTERTSVFNATPITFPASDGVTGYNDISPRVGLAYDLFGNGKTAVKATAGKYLAAATNGSPFINFNPAMDGRGTRSAAGINFVTNTTRSWIDGNGNKVVDCDLRNPAQHVAGGDTCGAWANQNFGNAAALQQVDPVLRQGWGVRPSEWYFGASVQQQLLDRVALDVAYNRRSFSKSQVIDNLAVGPDDFDTFTVTAPQHPDLPGGGGYSFPALTIKPNKFGQVQNFVTFSDNYGDETQYWHGVDATLTARLGSGFVLSGGTSTGRGVRDTCDIVAALPETLGANVRDGIEGCHVSEPWLTSVRGSVVYTVPRIDVLMSAVMRFQNTTVLSGGRPAATSGPSLTATYSIPNSVVAQSLGRLPAGGLANGTTAVNLLRTGELYPPQVRTVDMRFAKILRFSRTRTDVGLDLFNVFNSNAGTAFNPSFGLDGATWNRPTTILNPRTLRFNLTLAY